MSRAAIDQLFPISTPPKATHNGARSHSGDRELFRSHLDRAQDVAGPEKPVGKNAHETEPLPPEKPVQPKSDERDRSTTERDRTEAAQESPLTQEDSAETAPDEQPIDEVTLTATANAQAATTPAEATLTPGQVVVSTAAEGDASDQQSDSGEQPASPAATRKTAAEIATADGGVDVERTSASESGDETASEGKSATANTSQATANNNIPTDVDIAWVATTADEAGSNLQKSTSESTNNASADQQQVVVSETEPTEEVVKTRGDRFPVASATATTEQVAKPEAELATARLNTFTEVATNAPDVPAPIPGGEAVAGAGRSVVNALTDASGNSPVRTASPETPTVDQARFVQRVGGAIRSAEQRDGQIQLRLSPPELGTLRIQIEVKDGVVTARLEAETTAARTLLLDNLPALRERLAEQQIRIEKFDVDVGRDGQQAPDHPEAGERQANQSLKRTNKIATPTTTNSTTTAGPSDTNPLSPASGLDVRI